MSKSIRWSGLSALVLSGLFAVAAAPARPQEPAPEEPTTQEPTTDDAAKKPSSEGQFCGGFAAIQCPQGYSCVDDTNDTCDPNAGGADCGGICTAGSTSDAAPKKCDSKDPNLQYVSKDPEQCAAIRFTCDAGLEPFFNDCGCGCQPAAQ